MTHRAGLARVLAALDTHGTAHKEQSDGSYRARCPLHQGDTKTSFSVVAKDGRAAVHCFGGCASEDVLFELGLRVADLYDAPLPRRDAERAHPYESPSGRLLGAVMRLPTNGRHGSKFLPATPTSTGWAVKSNDEVKGTPYNLPALVAAIDRRETVYLCEGERDVDSLLAHGRTGTTNAHGADHWTAGHSRWLTGADVVVVQDRDEPGRKRGQAAVATLAGVASRVRLVEPAEGKDVTDHLAAGRTLDELVDVEIPTSGQADIPPPSRRLRVTRASQVRPRRVLWLWDHRIVLGGLTLLAGREGLGKSTIAVDVTAKVTRGVLDGERKGRPGTVIYVNSEDARDYTIVPRLLAAGADMDHVIFVDAVEPAEAGDVVSPLVLPLDVARLAEVTTANDAALVVLDAATSVIDSRLDGDRDRQMRQGLEAIARGVGEHTGCAVLGIVHFGKRESSDTGKLILGSIAWSQVARSVLAVARDDDSGDLIVSTTKANLGPGASSLGARIVSATVPTPEGETSVGRVEWLGETDRNARDLLSAGEVDERSELDEARQWLHDHLTTHGATTAGEAIRAAKKVGIAERTLQRARKKSGISSRKAADAWVWDLPDQGATDKNAVTSGDAKPPPDVHVHDGWRVGGLASSDPPPDAHDLALQLLTDALGATPLDPPAPAPGASANGHAADIDPTPWQLLADGYDH